MPFHVQTFGTSCLILHITSGLDAALVLYRIEQRNNCSMVADPTFFEILLQRNDGRTTVGGKALLTLNLSIGSAGQGSED